MSGKKQKQKKHARVWSRESDTRRSLENTDSSSELTRASLESATALIQAAKTQPLEVSQNYLMSGLQLPGWQGNLFSHIYARSWTEYKTFHSLLLHSLSQFLKEKKHFVSLAEFKYLLIKHSCIWHHCLTCNSLFMWPVNLEIWLFGWEPIHVPVIQVSKS